MAKLIKYIKSSVLIVPFTVFVAISLFLGSCNKESDSTLELSVRTDKVLHEAGSVFVSVKSEREWTLALVDEEDKVEWASLSVIHGQGTMANIVLSYEENISENDRFLYIVADNGKSWKRITFTQLSSGENPGDPEDPEEPENPEEPEEPENPEDPDIPGEDPPVGLTGDYSWYELPKINAVDKGDYFLDSSNQLYFAHHLCAGPEKGPGGKQARNYTVCYSGEHHCPVWVAAPRHTMYESGAKRTDAYGKDPKIPSDIQYNSKNTGGGCNKGHMLGSAERLSSKETNRQVFYYTNIAPQYSDTFNIGGGGWNILEDWVDGQVCSDTLYVVIGTYFETYTDKRGYTDSPKTISFGGRNDVTRPSMYYYILMRTKKGNSGKALKDCSSSEIKCAAFVRSHATPKGINVSSADLMSVSDLEKLTGFEYFPNVPHAPKSSYTASDWGL